MNRDAFKSHAKRYGGAALEGAIKGFVGVAIGSTVGALAVKFLADHFGLSIQVPSQPASGGPSGQPPPGGRVA